MTQEAMKLALEALKMYGKRHRATYLLGGAWDEEITLGDKAITALKEALTQTQEPFAYVNVEKRRLEFASPYVKWDTPTTIKLDKIPLYTTPPQRTWVGLTDEEICTFSMWLDDKSDVTVFTAIEAKLKQQNGYAEEKNT